MKNNQRAIWMRRIAIVTIAALCVSVFTGTALAEFTKSYRAKRVIAAVDDPGMLFSSNYLREGLNPSYTSFQVDTASDVPATSVITVNNFALGNPMKNYPEALTYTLEASVVRLVQSGGDIVPEVVTTNIPAVEINGRALASTGGTTSFTSTLATGAANTDTYPISLPKTMLTGEKLYLYVTATPDASHSDLHAIAGFFHLTERIDSAHVDWSLDPTDDRTITVSDFSGFNYRLTGSGAGTIILGWDPAVLTLSKVFKDKVNAAAAGSLPAGWTGLTAVQFEVDSDNINSYDIQFYQAFSGSVGSWSDVDVRMSFAEDDN